MKNVPVSADSRTPKGDGWPQKIYDDDKHIYWEDGAVSPLLHNMTNPQATAGRPSSPLPPEAYANTTMLS